MVTSSHNIGSPSAAEDPLVTALGQTTFVITAVLNRLAAEHDLSLTQLRVLGILRDRRARVTVLADHLGLEKSTMTGLVDRGVHRGLLARAPSPGDGRAVDVFLTSAGLDLADRLYREFAGTLTPLTQTLNPGQHKRLTALLRLVLDSTRSLRTSRTD